MELESRTDDAHREVLGLLPADLFDLSDLEVGIARLVQMLAAAPVELPDTVTLEDHRVATDDGHELLVRVYRPVAAPTPAPTLYWMHGGGMVLGDVSLDDGGCAAFAEELQIVVASVDYRLAPTWPYPTPLDDCHAGLRWVVAEADRLGLDRDRIAIGGGSAGGGLAAGLSLLLRDRAQFRPCLQLLRYPMIDDRNDTWSSHAITDGRVWNRAANLAGWSAYLGDRVGSADVDAYAAPARAEDLTGLPPAIVTVGHLDLSSTRTSRKRRRSCGPAYRPSCTSIRDRSTEPIRWCRTRMRRSDGGATRWPRCDARSTTQRPDAAHPPTDRTRTHEIQPQRRQRKETT